MTKVKAGVKILIWLGFSAFFIYSYQSIMDLEDLGNPRRQENMIRVLTALSKPNLFEYEYETRETPIVLESDCTSSATDASQAMTVGERTIVLDFDCDNQSSRKFTFHGTGFQPNIEGSIGWVSHKIKTDHEIISDSKFKTDSDGDFSITLTKIYYPFAHIVTGDTLVIFEILSTTIIGFSEDSYIAMEKMWETVQMGFLATILSYLLAIPFIFLGARVSTRWGRALRILLHPIFAVIRSIHPLITVMVVVGFVGLGPSAGVLAITLFSTAVLFVKFSDYADEYKNLEWPALLKVYFPSIAFKYFPTNTLIATVIGFMGGGGIGFILQQNLNLLNYRDASVSLLAIIITISSIDLISRAVWHKIQRSRIATLENEELLSRI